MVAEGPYAWRHVSVEQQRRDPGSLLNWMTSMIRLRKLCPAHVERARPGARLRPSGITAALPTGIGPRFTPGGPPAGPDPFPR